MYLCTVERFIRYLSHISLIGRVAAIWVTSFLKSLDRGIPGLKFRPYLFMENISTNSKTFKLWRESLLNGCKTSNVWLPSISCLHPITTCFSVTCPRLDEIDGGVFTWRHCGHVGVSNESSWNWALLSSKRFVLVEKQGYLLIIWVKTVYMITWTESRLKIATRRQHLPVYVVLGSGECVRIKIETTAHWSGRRSSSWESKAWVVPNIARTRIRLQSHYAGTN